MMKLIAHRGASLERPENTLESLHYGSELGAYAVECDIRLTSDGRYVIFHDDNLSRLGKDPRKVSEVTFAEMSALLAANGNHLMTLEELLTYHGSAYVLLHIKIAGADEAFFERLATSPVRFICGMTNVNMTKAGSRYFPPERILAFMGSPATDDGKKELAQEFYKAGAGNIRLWEQWLPTLKPADIKALCPNVNVWIMSNRPGTGMNGTRESLAYLDSIGADGVLLNDIRLGVEYYQ